MPRLPLNLQAMSSNDLRDASQGLFVRIVDADLKRNSRNDGNEVPGWITHALRTEHLDRWRVTLHRMLTQVEGRLRVLAAEWEASEPALQGQAREEKRAEYLGQKVRSERFRSGVLDALAEADMLYESRVGVLEEAIRAHRDEVDADDSIDASAADERLWQTLND